MKVNQQLREGLSFRPALYVALGASVAVLVSGCNTRALVGGGGDAIGSQLEIPSMENQLNRVMVGMSTIRVNNAIANMPISADAQWPQTLTEDLDSENKKKLERILEKDPYVATHEVTDMIQQDRLGGFAWATPKISTITYNAANKVRIIYGENDKNWPTMFDLSSDFETYDQFLDGKPKTIEAISGNVHENYSAAVIALMPVNYQKELETLRDEMQQSIQEVALAEAEKGKLDTQLESGKDAADQPLSEADRQSLNMRIETLDVELEQKKSVADEKETIYLTKLDEAVEVLKGDINLDENNIKLAKNIALVSGEIKAGALEAGLAFGVALTNLTIKGSIQNFPEEQATLVVGKALVPADKQTLYNERMERLAKNFVYALPAVGMGSYYAVKQSLLAGKYETVAETILDADEARKAAQAEQDALQKQVAK